MAGDTCGWITAEQLVIQKDCQVMTLTAIITMIVIITTIVGGFIYFLTIAIRKEQQKKGQEDN